MVQSLYIVTYDLNKPGQKYNELYDTLKNFLDWAHPMESTWFIVSPKSATQVRDILESKIDTNDNILVVNFPTYSWAGYHNKPKIWKWLKKYRSMS